MIEIPQVVDFQVTFRYEKDWRNVMKKPLNVLKVISFLPQYEFPEMRENRTSAEESLIKKEWKCAKI